MLIIFVILFVAGTICDNIASGRLHAVESDLIKAAKDANIQDFIEYFREWMWAS
jgi:ABC-type multidrug transport system fused ATPase/permease subunit